MTDLPTPSAESPIEVEDAIALQDEDGKDHIFHVIDILELSGKDYALLAPEMDDGDADDSEEDDDDDEFLIVRLEKNRTDVVMIEDEAEFNAVAAEIERLADEEEGESTPEP